MSLPLGHGSSLLAPWASHPESSRGRRISEASAPTRNDFQRDRDRIIHSSAFRRLVYKTQVFLNHEGDLFRTRLTHSLEVAQLARSVARCLALHEDLVEAIALAHDLGHTPFGHAGQDALHECMAGHGGFEHNLQSLRVVDQLEKRYPEWEGLNLAFETREGILKRCPRALAEQLEVREPGGVGRRFLEGTQPSLEAQLTNVADEIAYNAHDVDDGVRSGLITLTQLIEVPLIEETRRAVLKDHPALTSEPPRRLLAEIIRRLLSAQVYDLIAATQFEIARHAPRDANQARQLPPMIRFSDEMRTQSTVLKRFLFAALYRHPRVMETTAAAKQTLIELFHLYANDSSLLPQEFDTSRDGLRAVADYIAGMTDRFAVREHRRLTGRTLLPTA